ncbi:unnamed protein product [Camellia sinensis]
MICRTAQWKMGSLAADWATNVVYFFDSEDGLVSCYFT